MMIKHVLNNYMQIYNLVEHCTEWVNFFDFFFQPDAWKWNCFVKTFFLWQDIYKFCSTNWQHINHISPSNWVNHIVAATDFHMVVAKLWVTFSANFEGILFEVNSTLKFIYNWHHFTYTKA